MRGRARRGRGHEGAALTKVNVASPPVARGVCPERLGSQGRRRHGHQLWLQVGPAACACISEGVRLALCTRRALTPRVAETEGNNMKMSLNARRRRRKSTRRSLRPLTPK